jgi:GNAT superfamily N-acetyltransferase
MLYATQVASDIELQQILILQQQNLRGINNEKEEKEQGFVTVAHTLEILQQMHRLESSVIVKVNGGLAGYALVMAKESRSIVPELFSLFRRLNTIQYKGKLMSEYSFYVMGQICVAKEFRGKGVFDMLYGKHKDAFQNRYDFVITQIATRNTRSLRAHERVGFKTINIHTDELDEWALVVWDWTSPPAPLHGVERGALV